MEGKRASVTQWNTWTPRQCCTVTTSGMFGVGRVLIRGESRRQRGWNTDATEFFFHWSTWFIIGSCTLLQTRPELYTHCYRGRMSWHGTSVSLKLHYSGLIFPELIILLLRDVTIHQTLTRSQMLWIFFQFIFATYLSYKLKKALMLESWG